MHRLRATTVMFITALALWAPHIFAYEIVIPAYFGTPVFSAGVLTGDYGRIADAARSNYQVTTIVNAAPVGSGGPGAAREQVWADAIGLMNCGNCSDVLGFVFTNYGMRPLDLIKADIDKWYSWYPVTGIFLDELPSELDMLGPNRDTYLANYAAIYDYIKMKGDMTNTRVMANPGTRTDELFLTGGVSGGVTYGRAADDLILLENTAACVTGTGTCAGFGPTTWSQNPAYRDSLGYIIHSEPGPITSLLADIAAQNAGIVYVTDGMFNGPDDNRYTQLPSYWTTLLAGADICPPIPVPEPSTALLLIACLGAFRARRARA